MPLNLNLNIIQIFSLSSIFFIIFSLSVFISLPQVFEQSLFLFECVPHMTSLQRNFEAERNVWYHVNAGFLHRVGLWTVRLWSSFKIVILYNKSKVTLCVCVS